MSRTAHWAIAAAFVVGLAACQKTAPAPVVSHASADPEIGSNAAGMDGIGAFVGTWSGHGGEVVIDQSGSGTRTTYDNSVYPGTKTTKGFRITEIRRGTDRLTATYKEDDDSGAMTFYCTPDNASHIRGDLDMDSWPLVDEESLDQGWEKHDAVIRDKQAQYCANPS